MIISPSSMDDWETLRQSYITRVISAMQKIKCLPMINIIFQVRLTSEPY